MSAEKENSKRIAKNTLALYFRMILIMLVSLYTSRVVLETLGVTDFGIYNVVGGVVTMFHMISNALSGAISRYLNYEMGVGSGKERLRRVFSTSLNVQFLLIFIIVFFAETVGLWFLNNKMVIPLDRIEAANWVYQCSIVTFCISLISLPYNATIIAHERMKAFAYLGIFEVLFKLFIVYLLLLFSFDKLVLYAILCMLIAVSMRFIYGYYCSKHFEECHYSFVLDKVLLKEMFGYAGWNFLGSASSVLRGQGVNIVINLFFGPNVNAARGISTQVNSAVYRFITNFTMALNPQIVQNYASGNYDYCLKLVFQGARLSYYMLLLLSLPIIFETQFILSFWLKEVPLHTVLFVRLVLILSMCSVLSTTLMKLILSDRNIRDYQIVVGLLCMLNIPIDYIFLRWFDMSPEGTVVIAIIIELITLFARLFMIKRIIPFSPLEYFKKVIVNVLFVTFMSLILPLSLQYLFSPGMFRFILVLFISFSSSLFVILYIGCSRTERKYVLSKMLDMFEKLRKHNYNK